MLPQLHNVPAQSSMIIDKFKGINVTNSYEPGELTDCTDVDSSAYPAIGTRKARTLCSSCDGIINGTGSFDGYLYTYYTENPGGIFLKFKEISYEFTSFTNIEDYTAKRSFAFLENSILIIPDNVVFYTDTLSFKAVDINQEISFDTANAKVFEEVHSGFGRTLSRENNLHIGEILSDRLRSVEYSYVDTNIGQEYIYPVEFDRNIEIGDILTIKICLLYTSPSPRDRG